MSKSKMSREELNAKSLMLGVLIEKASEAGVKAVAEMSKHPLSVEQAKEQIRKHHAEADHVWKYGKSSKPVS